MLGQPKDSCENRPCIFFSAGEPSGDLHASRLAQELGDKFQFRGFGGPQLASAGCSLDYTLTDLAVVGFVEVIPKLREFFRVADIASEVFQNERPAAVVLVDFPGFNWHIAKRAKAEGIPVFYYLPPQLWAWGSWRIRKMRRYVDHILCNLPFEQQWYEQRGMQAHYVGHPFFDDLNTDSLDREFIGKLSSDTMTQVAVLPGSRGREVKNIWPMQLEIIREIAAKHPSVQFQIACLKKAHRDQCENNLRADDKTLPIEFHVGRTSELIELADCALVKSGSVSLELMARGTPTVVLYHVSRTLYYIAKMLTDIKSITLPNMISGRTVMPEYLAVGGNRGPTIQSCTQQLDLLIGDENARAEQRRQLQQLTEEFGQAGASHRAASFIRERLGVEHSIPLRRKPAA